MHTATDNTDDTTDPFPREGGERETAPPTLPDESVPPRGFKLLHKRKAPDNGLK